MHGRRVSVEEVPGRGDFVDYISLKFGMRQVMPELAMSSSTVVM